MSFMDGELHFSVGVLRTRRLISGVAIARAEVTTDFG